MQQQLNASAVYFRPLEIIRPFLFVLVSPCTHVFPRGRVEGWLLLQGLLLCNTTSLDYSSRRPQLGDGCSSIQSMDQVLPCPALPVAGAVHAVFEPPAPGMSQSHHLELNPRRGLVARPKPSSIVHTHPDQSGRRGRDP